MRSRTRGSACAIAALLGAGILGFLLACTSPDGVSLPHYGALDAGAFDAQLDAKTDVPDANDVTCPTSIAAYTSGCLTSPADGAPPNRWPPCTFADARAMCGASLGLNLYVSTAECGGYDTAGLSGTDSAQIDYFDHVTGALVAVIQYPDIPQGPICVAGPSKFVVPDPCGSANLCANDASSDTGAADAR